MTDVDVSVIIVNWNTRAYLHDCLAALQACDGVSSEIIVVDNGSIDDSVTMVRANFPEVRLVANKRNVGFAVANNQGLAYASAPFIVLLNSDTRVAPTALRELVAFMTAHERVGACGPMLLNIDGSLQPSGRSFPTVVDAIAALVPLPQRLRTMLAPSLEQRDYGLCTAVDEVSGAAICLRASALRQVGLLDESFYFLGEDIDLCWRMRNAGWHVYYVPSAIVTHVWGGSSKGRGERTSLLAQRAYVLLICKHRSRLAGWTLIGAACALTVGKGINRVLPALGERNWKGARSSLHAHLSELMWLLTR